MSLSESDSVPSILLVDDVVENIDVLRGILAARYRIKVATNGEKALEICRRESPPDMILLDIMMPGLDGYEVCKTLKSDPSTRRIPIIFVTAKDAVEDESYGLRLGAADYIAKPVNPDIVLARVQTQFSLLDQATHLEQLVDERTKELQNTRLQLINCLGRAAEYKDNETGMHVVRMSKYSKILAEKASSDRNWSELVYHASPMHDIGKIGIPDHVLLKPGKLDAEEWELMKKHPEYGAKIIGDQSSDVLKMAGEIAISHHERWDGTGYPNGLNGQDIPLAGRIVAICDVFDALTSERPYKKAWSIEDAAKHIVEGAGAHFDPALCELFKECVDDFYAIHMKYSD